MKSESLKDPYLDGLRGVAVLCVVAFHAFSHFLNPVLAQNRPGILFFTSIPDFGSLGVDLFFVLSGFLITRILFKTKKASNYYSSFFARRALRILPLYYTVLFILLYLSPRLVAEPWFNAHQFWYWFYLQNWMIAACTIPNPLTHFWSLAIEEQFYLIWPFFIRRSVQREILVLGLLSWPLISLLRAYYYWGTDLNATEITLNTFVRLDRFLLGAALAAFLDLYPRHKHLYRGALSLMLVSGAGLLYAKYADLGYNARCALSLALTPIFAVALLALSQNKSATALRSRAGLNSPALRSLGQFSYGIYVLHYPIDHFTYSSFMNHPWIQSQIPELQRFLFFLLSLVTSYGLARLTWVLLEQPFLNLKTRFRARIH
jgi:peptidoglycan/LPS O-acetylase OafA/YrhL